jgi:hypothetical protein
MLKVDRERTGIWPVVAQRDRDGPSNRYCACRAPEISVGDAPLVVCGAQHRRRVVRKQKTNRSGTHCAAVPCCRRRSAGFFPWDSFSESAGSPFGRQASANDSVLGEQRCDAAGVVGWFEAATFDEASNELAGQLRVVRVLADRKVAAGVPFKLLWSKGGIDEVRARVGRVAFDDEAHGIANSLQPGRSGIPRNTPHQARNPMQIQATKHLPQGRSPICNEPDRIGRGLFVREVD